MKTEYAILEMIAAQDAGDWERDGDRLWVPSDQYATPQRIIEKVTKVFCDGWADPCTCLEAILSLPAVLRPWETIELGRDFLNTTPDWTTLPVFMNPPYSRDVGGAGEFTDHLISQNKDAIVLVNAATSTNWWQHLAESSSNICFVDKRIKFDRMFREVSAPLSYECWREPTTRPRYANVIHLISDNTVYQSRFKQHFSKLGVVV